MKKKTVKKRVPLKTQVRDECSQWNKQFIARYGKKIPVSREILRDKNSLARQLNFISYVQDHWKREQLKRTDGKMFIPKEFQDHWFSKFMWPLVKLDENFFFSMAKAIRIYKQTPPEGCDPLIKKLSDPALWLAHPPLTFPQMKTHVGYTGGDRFFRELVNDLNVPHTKSKGGRPRKTRSK